MAKSSSSSTQAKKAEYSVKELAASAHTFGDGVTSDCVIAALRVAKTDNATKETAKKIVEDFMNKEVK